MDILEQERSHNRISEGAYRTGRFVQEVFEITERMLGSNWRMDNRVDSQSPIHSRMDRALDHACKIVPLFQDIRSRLGTIDARLLRAVLGDRLGFADCAEIQGKTGDRGSSYVATRFRDALEDLAHAWSAKGPSRPTPADAFARLADSCSV